MHSNKNHTKTLHGKNLQQLIAVYDSNGFNNFIQDYDTAAEHQCTLANTKLYCVVPVARV